MSALQALYGGTFDPIHFGHLRTVEALAQQVKLQRVTFMPNNVPPHRPQPVASSEQRKTMVALAIRGNPLFDMDERELLRSSPSYTAETLAQWRKEKGTSQPLAFIIGQDSLLSLPTWYQYDTLLKYCHILVCRRPGYAVKMRNTQEQQWLEQHLSTDLNRLHHEPAGCIWLAQTPLIAISATDIRERLHKHLPCDGLLPAAVEKYINQQGLYRTG